MAKDREIGDAPGMHRRRFVQRLATGSVALPASVASIAPPGARAAAATNAVPAAGAAVSAEAAGPVTSTPLGLQAPRADGFEAVWGVRRLARGRVEWETEGGATGTAGTDRFGFTSQGASVIRVRVDGLPPGTTGRFRSTTVASGDGRTEVSDWKPFRTLDPRAAATRFAVWNDTHVNQATLEALDTVTPEADFLLWNGDTCNDWTREELLVPTLLHPGGRDITRNRPLLLTWGNHDVRGPWAFRVPDLMATPSGRPFYAFRSGPVGVICLHTGEDKPDDHPSFAGRVAFDALRREQAAWLAEATRLPALAEAPFRLVFCHIPLRWLDESRQDYERGGFDRHSGRSRAAWHDALVAWKAQVIVSGHTHRPAWIPPAEGFPYGQLVGGGPQPASATWMEGRADARELRLVLRNLEGRILHEVAFPPLA